MIEIKKEQRDSTLQISRLVEICAGLNAGVLDIQRASRAQQEYLKISLSKIENRQLSILQKTQKSLVTLRDIKFHLNKTRFAVYQIARMLGDFSKETLELLREILESNFEMYALLRSIASQMPGRVFNADVIHFQDALGRSEDLPYQYFCDWQVFKARLQCRFKAVPGEYRVERGMYLILNAKASDKIISQEDWSRAVFPDARLHMSMQISEKEFEPGHCPRPDCGAQNRHNTRSSSTAIIWYVSIHRCFLSSAHIICSTECGLEYHSAMRGFF